MSSSTSTSTATSGCSTSCNPPSKRAGAKQSTGQRNTGGSSVIDRAPSSSSSSSSSSSTNSSSNDSSFSPFLHSQIPAISDEVHESFEHLRGLAKVLTYWMPPPKALSFTHFAVMCHQKGELGVHLVSHNMSEFDKSRAGAPCYPIQHGYRRCRSC
mgnify:CR=1 FL=1